jgi:hypothetical protein
MSKLDPISFIIANIGSLTDDEFDRLKETMIEEIACRAATEAAARAEAAFGLSLRIYGDTPLTGNAAAPPPPPTLYEFDSPEDAKEVIHKMTTDSMMNIARRDGIASAIGWARLQEGMVPPIYVRTYIWFKDEDLAETLGPIIERVTAERYKYYMSEARTHGIRSANEWLEQKKKELGRWIPAEDDYSGELIMDIPPYVPFPTVAASAPAPAPSAPSSTKKSRPNYNHHYWPSPRARNFAKALGHTSRNHEEALNCLASEADITVEQLMNTSPHEYAERHTPKYALSSVMPGIRRPSYY